MKKALGYTAYFLAIIIFSVFFIRYIGQRTIVEGNSMLPALADADQLVSDKISYRFRDPERFDIIFFPYEYEEGTYYIKRIIGLPGETVRIDPEGSIYINGELLEEHYGLEPIEYAGLAEEGIALEEDEYFVSPWKKTSILSWETTAISARTAATLTWAMSGGRTS